MDDYRPTTWIDSMWKIRKSPIAEEAIRREQEATLDEQHIL